MSDEPKRQSDPELLAEPLKQIVKVQMPEICRANGWDFRPFETLRSKERQIYLFCQGRDLTNLLIDIETMTIKNAQGVQIEYKDVPVKNASQIVTKTLLSKHLPNAEGKSIAVDMVHFTGKDWDWGNIKAYDLFGQEVIKKFGDIIEWGGLWKFKDYPHFQLKAGV
jgi:hypothetical protein